MGHTGQGVAGGWTERLERIIPGIGAYQDREGLREMDKRVRTHLGDLLARLARELEPAQRLLTDGGRLDHLPALDRIGRLASTLADRLRFASYGFAGVFDLHKIREPELMSLHDFDLKLLEEIPRLQFRVHALAEAAAQEGGLSQALQATEEGLRGFEDTLEERDRLARGL
ncbi:MAG TPA: hypothetical protein VF579_08640 [Candidatus Methylomirabilis sp.]